jgi:hypothetical protein
MLPVLMVGTIAVLASSLSGAVEMGPNGFVARHELVIGAPAAKVYESLLGQVGAWWSGQHTYSGDSKHLSIVSQ